MRTMKNKKTGSKLNITQHIILRNGWEYYITDNKFDEGIYQALVMGYETEIGDVFLPEILSCKLSATSDLREVLPATGYEWVR